MLIIKDTERIPKQSRGYSVAIGNFDGFHKGHIAILNSLKKIAFQNKQISAIMSFSPHPREFFENQKENFNIYSRSDKINFLKKFDIDIYIEFNFDKNLQLELAKELANIFGYDFNIGRMDLSQHPFSTGNGNDVRITTRVDEKDPFNCFYFLIPCICKKNIFNIQSYNFRIKKTF